mgnify:CR=1 FL=1
MPTHLPDDIGTLAKIGGAVATAFSAVIAGGIAMWKATGRRIAAVEAKLDTKADVAEVTRIRDAQGKIFDQMREDKTEILGAIGDLKGSFHDFSNKVTEELGKRPTREELKR